MYAANGQRTSHNLDFWRLEKKLLFLAKFTLLSNLKIKIIFKNLFATIITKQIYIK